MRATILRALRRFDAGLAACEVVLLCLLVAGLIAGGLALVVRQNTDADTARLLPSGLFAVGLLLLIAAGVRRSGRALLAGAFLALLAGQLHLDAAVDYLVRVSVLWIGLVGASLATRENRHITIEALTRALPGRTRGWAGKAVGVAACFILVVLAVVACEYVMDTRARNEIFYIFEGSGFELRGWWVKSILPLGFGVMAWRFFLGLFVRDEA
ncbi:MAG: TRAP transporter small permease [Planctomycetota bacterium]|jgi:hypothetical protein